MIFLIALGLVLVGAVGAGVVIGIRARRLQDVPFRTNVRGIEVPVFLGDALAAGTAFGSAALLVVALISGEIPGVLAAVVLVTGLMWAAGAWDDRRGDERARGFKGHLGALRTKSLTGGLVKILGGAVAGLGAAAFLPANGAAPAIHVVESIALVALSANLVNLLDRAPGRAGKVALIAGGALAVFGSSEWGFVALPVLGALLVCLRLDLREQGMLGDAGANPLGAVVGVGLVASLGATGRLVAIAVLLALNLASEKWSFSRVIERTPPLRWFDGLGRLGQPGRK